MSYSYSSSRLLNPLAGAIRWQVLEHDVSPCLCLSWRQPKVQQAPPSGEHSGIFLKNQWHGNLVLARYTTILRLQRSAAVLGCGGWEN